MPTVTASDVALIGRVREADAEARAAQTRVFLLAAEWADAHLDPDAPPTSGECLHGCRAADRHDVEVGDFAGGCAGGCVGDPDGFHDPFIPVVRWDAAGLFERMDIDGRRLYFGRSPSTLFRLCEEAL